MEELLEPKSIYQIYNESMKEIANSLLDKTTDTTEAIRLIDNLIVKINKEYDLTKEIHSFENPVERILYITEVNSSKNTNIVDIPVHYIYYFLGLAYLDDGIYEDALANFLKSISINPFFAKGIFKISECYRRTNELEKMYDFIINNHKYIYQAEDLSDFYSQLGDYYYDVKNYAFANTLYSYSEYYKSTGYNQKQLSNISRFEGRIVKVDTIEQVIPYLKEKQIPISISKKILQRLLKMYKVPADNSDKMTIKTMVKKILFDITKNEVFAPSSYLRNDEIGFIFQIPETWEVLSRANYNKNSTSKDTLFVIKPLSRVTININKIDKIKSNNLQKEYLEIKDKYIKEGYLIKLESLMKSGKTTYIQSFIEKKILNDSVIDVHNYVIINDNLIDFEIPVNSISFDKEKLLSDKNVIRINNLLGTLQIINIQREEEEEFTF
jgi:tetratricopeptide (TPR) repeat protein